MKRILVGILVILVLGWGCATLSNLIGSVVDNAEKGLEIADVIHEVTVATATYLREQNRITVEEWNKAVELDAKYHELHKIIEDTIIALKLAQEYDNQTDAKEQRAVLIRAIGDFTRIAMEFNAFIQELKEPGKEVKGEPL